MKSVSDPLESQFYLDINRTLKLSVVGKTIEQFLLEGEDPNQKNIKHKLAKRSIQHLADQLPRDFCSDDTKKRTNLAQIIMLIHVNQYLLRGTSYFIFCSYFQGKSFLADSKLQKSSIEIDSGKLIHKYSIEFMTFEEEEKKDFLNVEFIWISTPEAPIPQIHKVILKARNQEAWSFMHNKINHFERYFINNVQEELYKKDGLTETIESLGFSIPERPKQPFPASSHLLIFLGIVSLALTGIFLIDPPVWAALWAQITSLTPETCGVVLGAAFLTAFTVILNPPHSPQDALPIQQRPSRSDSGDPKKLPNDPNTTPNPAPGSYPPSQNGAPRGK